MEPIRILILFFLLLTGNEWDFLLLAFPGFRVALDFMFGRMIFHLQGVSERSIQLLHGQLQRTDVLMMTLV